MPPIAVALIVLACVFGGALLGIFLRAALPAHHLTQDSKDVVKLGMGLIATMTALVLGLVTASAKTSFDAADAGVKHSAVNILLLDRVLARYGPETKDIRALIRRSLAFKLNVIWPEDSSRPGKLDASQARPTIEGIEDRIRELTPKNGAQRSLQARALQIMSDLLQARWLILGVAGNLVPLPFLVVLVFWLTVIFASFGLYAPRNATVITVLFLCALSAAASVFLILEMDLPFEGLMKISSAPLRYALSQLGH